MHKLCVAGRTGGHTAFVTTRPCRAPRHTISEAGLIGGGQVPLPGEASLAYICLCSYAWGDVRLFLRWCSRYRCM
jgi:Magnesium chelatase, subunit ChlI